MPHVELSIVVAVYAGEACLDELCRRIQEACRSVTDRYEIILVDDRSPDASWEKIRTIAAANPNVRGVRLSRNFGQHRAITAGLAHARGDRVALLDCDLQDPPEEIPRLVKAADSGYDIVLVQRTRRKDGLLRRTASALFYRFMDSVLEGFVMQGVGTFSVLTRRAVDDFLKAADDRSHYLVTLKWIGHRTTILQVEQQARFAGKSSYTLRKLVTHTLEGLVSQSTRLLQLSTTLAFVFGMMAVVQGIYVAYRKIFLGIAVEGWASLMAALWLSTGAILFSLGVLGLYLGQVFERSRNRPLYFVAEDTEPRRSTDEPG